MISAVHDQEHHQVRCLQVSEPILFGKQIKVCVDLVDNKIKYVLILSEQLYKFLMAVDSSYTGVHQFIASANTLSITRNQFNHYTRGSQPGARQMVFGRYSDANFKMSRSTK